MNTLRLSRLLCLAALALGDEVTAVVVKRGNGWRIKRHDSNELLPQHYKTKEAADKALKAIWYFKKHGK